MRAFEVIKKRNIPFYPYPLLEAEIEFDDGEIVYGVIPVRRDETKYDYKRIWFFCYDFNKCQELSDDPNYNLQVYPAEREEVMKMLYKLWCENPAWNTEWE